MKKIAVISRNDYISSMIFNIFKEVVNVHYLNNMFNFKDNIYKNCDVLLLNIWPEFLNDNFINDVEFDLVMYNGLDLKNGDVDIDKCKNIFKCIRKGGFGIINSDDELSYKIVEGIDKIFLLTCGLNSKASITASSISYSFRGINFNYYIQRAVPTLSNKEIIPQEIPIFINKLGIKNIYYGLYAITTALLFDINVDILKRALLNLPAKKRQMEVIYDYDFIIIDNYVEDFDSYEYVFETVQSLEYGDLLILNSIRDIKDFMAISEVYESWLRILNLKRLILTNCSDIYDKKRECYYNLLPFANKISNMGVSVEFYENFGDAVERLLDLVKKDDLVLFLGGESMDDAKNMFIDKFYLKNIS